MVDWGWSRDRANPLAFRDWYVSQLSTPCPWHTRPEDGADGAGLPDVLTVRPEPGVRLHARKATRDRLVIGAELAARLAAILDKARQGAPCCSTTPRRDSAAG